MSPFETSVMARSDEYRDKVRRISMALTMARPGSKHQAELRKLLVFYADVLAAIEKHAEMAA